MREWPERPRANDSGPARNSDGRGGAGHDGLWRTHNDERGTDENERAGLRNEQLVLNERIDCFNAPPGGLSMEFHVAGHFLIADGVIREWKDWPVSGTKQKVGNSIREA